MKKINKISVFLALTLMNASAFAQGHVGGGDNFFPETGSAWFLGSDRSIHYCLDISPDFGISPEVAQDLIQKSFKKWADYMDLKEVNHSKYNESLTVNAQVQDCDGTEDLRFYLGKQDDLVTRVKAAEYDNPIGFASRQSYSISRGWGKGFIWLAAQGTVHVPNDGGGNHYPAWSNLRPFQAVITHELGHVYGCEHMYGTIMSEGIAHQIQYPISDNNQNVSVEIDQERELVRKYGSDDRVYVLSRARSFNVDTVFEVLMNRKPVGEPNIEIIRPGSSPQNFYTWLGLRLSDNLGTKMFNFENQSETSVYGGGHFFKAAKRDPKPGYSAYSSYNQEIADYHFSVKDTAQKKIWATLGWNGSSQAPVEFHLMADADFVLYFH